MGDKFGQAEILCNWGLLEEYRGELDTARDLYSQAERLFEEVGASSPKVEIVREALERLEPP